MSMSMPMSMPMPMPGSFTMFLLMMRSCYYKTLQRLPIHVFYLSMYIGLIFVYLYVLHIQLYTKDMAPDIA